LVVVVASDGRAQIALTGHALTGVSVDATRLSVGRFEILTRPDRGIAAIEDAGTEIFAKVWVAEVGIDALAAFADAWLTHVVTSSSDVYVRAESIFTHRGGTCVAVVSALRRSIALDTFAHVVAKPAAVRAANLVHGL
jgi:hypothetical protein